MTDLQVLKQLKKWLNKKGNSKAKLAKKLGYKSHTTINNWIKRKSVPTFRISEILKEIKC